MRLARPHALTTLLLGCASTPEDRDTTDTSPATDTSDPNATGPSGYVVGSIVIAESGRTLYVQFVDALSGRLDNTKAIEVPGNALLNVQGDDVFVGLVEEPTWIRYGVGDDGALAESGRLSFAAYGWSAIDYGNTFVRDDLAVSVNTGQLQAIFWNPQDLTILGTLELPQLAEAGYGVEVSPVTSYEGMVYIPGRHVDWEQGTLKHQTMLMVVDPDTRSVVEVLKDDRCPVSGAPIFDAAGNLFTMSDGRNYAIQMFARAAGETDIPKNCTLRQTAGGTGFDTDWSHDVVDLTGGHETLTYTWIGDQGTGVAFAKVFYEEELPDDVEPVDFSFWGYPMGRIWTFDFNTDPPTATIVDGLPFSGIGFGAYRVGDELMVGESASATGEQESVIYRLDAATSSAEQVFEMEGYFYGAYPIGGAK